MFCNRDFKKQMKDFKMPKFKHCSLDRSRMSYLISTDLTSLGPPKVIILERIWNCVLMMHSLQMQEI